MDFEGKKCAECCFMIDMSGLTAHDYRCRRFPPHPKNDYPGFPPAVIACGEWKTTPAIQARIAQEKQAEDERGRRYAEEMLDHITERGFSSYDAEREFKIPAEHIKRVCETETMPAPVQDLWVQYRARNRARNVEKYLRDNKG